MYAISPNYLGPPLPVRLPSWGGAAGIQLYGRGMLPAPTDRGSGASRPFRRKAANSAYSLPATFATNAATFLASCGSMTIAGIVP